MPLHYQPLRPDETRLLTLSRHAASAATGFHDVSLAFTVVSVTDVSLPSFTALSYVWGEASDTLKLQYLGGSLTVTRNLHAVLGCLASSMALDRGPAHLWIDAICIDQSNFDERAAQVVRMRQIYSRAASVLVFLSILSAPFELGLGFLDLAARHPTWHYEPSLEPHISLRPGVDAHSAALRDSIISIFATPWWTRVWTVQEFVLAGRVVFRCGQAQIAGETMLAAFESLKKHESGCCWLARRDADRASTDYIHIPSVPNGGMTLFEATMKLDQLQVMCNAEAYDAKSLLGALSMFRMRECTDPRDHIFAMLGLDLGHEGQSLSSRLRVDYTVPTNEIFQQVAIAMIQTLGNLDVLSHVCQYSSMPGRLRELPSWVPDWTAIVHETFHHWYSERTRRAALKKASGSLKPVWHIVGPGRAVTKAHFLGHVSTTAPGYPASESSLCGRQLVDRWREMFDQARGEESKASQPDFDFGLMISSSLAHAHWQQEAGKHQEAFRAWFDWFTGKDPQRLRESIREDIRGFDAFVKSTTLERRMFRTENGRVGFGPEAMEQGDAVVLMPGGRVPYVLRRVDGLETGLDGSDEIFRLLGDADVHGAMLGEAVEALDGDDRAGGGWEDISLI